MPEAWRRCELALFFFPKFKGAGGAFLGGVGNDLSPSSGLGEGSIKLTEGPWLDIGVFGGGTLGGGPLGGLEGRLLDGGRDAL